MENANTDLGYVVYDKHVAFWGSPFSNFYPCEIIVNEPWKNILNTIGGVSKIEEDFKWKSSEQLFMANKAWFFADMKTFGEIVLSTTPEQAKKLGRKVKGFDDKIWDKVKYQLMYAGVYAKFSQNEDLKNFLLSPDFEGKDFVEGSPFDGVWGVKMDWRNPDIDNPENWNGQNLLGKVLNEVREKLKED